MTGPLLIKCMYIGRYKVSRALKISRNPAQKEAAMYVNGRSSLLSVLTQYRRLDLTI